MHRVARPAALVAALLVASGAAACGSGSRTGTTTSTTGGAAAAATLEGRLTVFAAASLTGAFNAEKSALAATDPGLDLTLSFGGSQMLVTQITQGQPADVFASADGRNMQKLVAQGLVDTPRVFARNVLQIAVAPGNPKHINGLADLERPGITLVLGDPSVPVGKYAREAFARAGLPAPQPASNELDVKSVMEKLTSGEADAVVVYRTDVKDAGNDVTGIDIPASENVVAAYPIAVLRDARNHAAAEAFVNEIVSGSGQRALKDAGFLPAP